MIEPDHPDWYGAWWVGFVAAAIISLIASFLMFGFARRLPNSPTTNEVLEQSTKVQFARGWDELKYGIKVNGLNI